jgi:hypothetical protein
LDRAPDAAQIVGGNALRQARPKPCRYGLRRRDRCPNGKVDTAELRRRGPSRRECGDEGGWEADHYARCCGASDTLVHRHSGKGHEDAEASTENPELLIDMATLTGAARVALGPELAALFCNDEALAKGLLAAASAEEDPMWRMPLWRPYRKMIDSKVADINNVSESTHAGAITAALYLQEFVDPGIPWAHLDVMAWNPQSRPGRPEGAEATALRALYAHIA